MKTPPSGGQPEATRSAGGVSLRKNRIAAISASLIMHENKHAGKLVFTGINLEAWGRLRGCSWAFIRLRMQHRNERRQRPLEDYIF